MRRIVTEKFEKFLLWKGFKKEKANRLTTRYTLSVKNYQYITIYNDTKPNNLLINFSVPFIKYPVHCTKPKDLERIIYKVLTYIDTHFHK